MPASPSWRAGACLRPATAAAGAGALDRGSIQMTGSVGTVIVPPAWLADSVDTEIVSPVWRTTLR